MSSQSYQVEITVRGAFKVMQIVPGTRGETDPIWNNEKANYYQKSEVDNLLLQKADQSALDTHINDQNNPHNVNKTQVGLGNVDNVKQLPYSILTTKGDLLTHDGNNPVRLPIGNPNTFLKATTNGVVWDTINVSGKEEFNIVIDPGGNGDYTSLSDYLPNAVNGDRVLIKGEITEDTALTIDKSILISGYGFRNSFINLGTNGTITISANNVVFQNLGFKATTGRTSTIFITSSGENAVFRNLYFDVSLDGANNTCVLVKGLHNRVENIFVEGFTNAFIVRVYGTTGKFAYVKNIYDRGAGTTGGATVKLDTTYYAFVESIYSYNRRAAVEVYWTYYSNVSDIYTSYNVYSLYCNGSNYYLFVNGVYGYADYIYIDYTYSSAFLNIWTETTNINFGNGNLEDILFSNIKSSYIYTSVDWSGRRIMIRNADLTSYLYGQARERNERIYVWRKNNDTTSVNQFEVVIEDTSAPGFAVKKTTTAGDYRVRGVVLSGAGSGAHTAVLTYGWTKVKVNGTTPISVGDYLSCHSDPGIAKKATSGETAFAIALGSYSNADSNGLIECFVITPLKI